MPPATAFHAVHWVLKAFRGIRQVQFFGGEPLLNPRLIVEICEYFQALEKSGSLEKAPRFSLVTNGTLGSPPVLRLLERYRIAVTVSIDGPEEIHDILRGRGSFAKADRFALECLNTLGIPTEFECTWTGMHAARGISVVQLMDFFHERYGVHVLHVVPVSAPPGSPLAPDEEVTERNYREAARRSIRSLAAGRIVANSLSHRIMLALSLKQPLEGYCPAGRGTLSVGADGGLYPCFMFTGIPQFRIARFSEGGGAVDHDSQKVSDLLQSWDKSRRPECRVCWARPLCTGCIGSDYLNGRELGRRDNCRLVRAIAEAVLLETASLCDS